MKRIQLICSGLTAILLTAGVSAAIPAGSASAASATGQGTCKGAVLSSISLPSLTYVGDHPALTLTLSCAAQEAVDVLLTSSNSNVPVPGKVKIAPGTGSTTVTLAPEADELGQYQSTITASYAGTTLTSTITVDPGLSLVQTTPVGGEPDFVSVNVLLTGQAPAGGLTLTISSSSSAVTMPASFTIQQYAIGVGFNALSQQDVTQDTPVTISVTLGDQTQSTSIVLLPPFTSGDSITLVPETPGPLYGPSLGNGIVVNLSNPAAVNGNGLTASVTTSDPGDVQLDQSSVLFTPGSDQEIISFSVPFETSVVDATVTVTLDGVTASIPVTIEPSLDSFTLPASIVGGQSATGTLSLAGPVDTPTTVSLQSTIGILSVPGTVTIPAGASSATFQITTVPVTSDEDASIVAFLGSTSIQSDNIDVTP
jgi:hypothetical protein